MHAQAVRGVGVCGMEQGGPTVLWVGRQHTSLVDGSLHRSQGTCDVSTSRHGTTRMFPSRF